MNHLQQRPQSCRQHGYIFIDRIGAKGAQDFVSPRQTIITAGCSREMSVTLSEAAPFDESQFLKRD